MYYTSFRRANEYHSFCRLGASLLGYDLGVISYVIVAKNFLSTIGMETEQTYNDNYIGFIVSSMLLG